MEVLVAVVLLAGVGVMSMHSFVSSAEATKPGAGVAFSFGRGLLEQMRERVRQDRWTTGSQPLSLSSPTQFGTKTLNGITYTPVYTTAAGDPDGDSQEDYRRVTMTVSW